MLKTGFSSQQHFNTTLKQRSRGGNLDRETNEAFAQHTFPLSSSLDDRYEYA
jgi:hypothetical protein